MVQRVFEALASEVRRRMLAELAAGELSAGEIAGRFDISKPAISQHLSVLDAAGLVVRRKKGQFVYYSLAAGVLHEALAGLTAETTAPVPAAPEGPAPEVSAPQAPALEAEPAQTRRNLPPVPPAEEMSEPRSAVSALGGGYRWEAWRSRGGP